MKDIQGQRFGRLTAVERTDQKKDATYIWECKCDCGNTHFTSLHNLTTGGTKSCGCLRAELMSETGRKYGSRHGKKSAKNILGQRFSRLVVVEKTALRAGKNVVWKCKCDCGELCYVSGYNLRHSFTRSCGCMRVEAGMKNIPALQESRPLIDGTDVRMISDMTVRSDNKTGVRGVSWDKNRQCYRAMITFKGKSYYLGRFSDLEKAKEIRLIAEEKMFGEFLDWYYEEFPERLPKRNRGE